MARIVILYNEPVLPANHPDAESERDLLHTVEAIARILQHSAHQVVSAGLKKSPEELLQVLAGNKPDLVFNLFEGFGDKPASEYYIAGLLEWLAVPYTGCPLEAMVLGRDKVRTKYLLRGAGLPTADFQVVSTMDEVSLPTAWPVIVKPAGTDASIGIHQDSVVTSDALLRNKVSHILKEYGAPVLVESYLPGTEFNVGVIDKDGLMALPVAEMVYTPQPGVQWPIVSYESKWEIGSADDLAMQPRCPAQINPALSLQLQELALSACRLVGCRDYARVDFRLDEHQKPHIMEVNPNPDLGESAGLARMVRAQGMTYEELIVQFVRNHSGHE